jgi:hypothetical protein
MKSRLFFFLCTASMLGATSGLCAADDRSRSRATPASLAPSTFGSAGGGVWKTQNAGRTWFPISDWSIPIVSIGAIAVALSNPDTV